jgi:hypothetical protein
MTKARLDGLYLLLLGATVFVLLGTTLEHSAPAPMSDFKAVYYGARLLIQHTDPYKYGEILRAYQADGGTFPSDPDISRSVRRSILVCINLPVTLFLVSPFAMLPLVPAHMLWMTLMFGSIIFAAFLMWNLGANYAPAISGLLIGFMLANSEVLVIIGNSAGIVVSLCVIAVWCFLKPRFVLVGVLCLAISLAAKPHDAGPVWLYFLLAGGVYRKRALQTLLVTLVLALPAVLLVSNVAPQWPQELHSNLLATSARGDLNDPGPTSMGAHTLGMIISLQTVVSVFRDDPRIYNPVTYLICAPPLLLWAFVTLRSRFSPERAWLALAAIAPLAMLPVYHRIYDAKLLMLTVPACAMLWAEGGLIGWLAPLLTAAGFVVTGDLPWVIFLSLIRTLHLPAAGTAGRMVASGLVFPVPLTLLAMGVFYLWVYVRRCSTLAVPAESGSSEGVPIAPERLDSGIPLNSPFRKRIPSSCVFLNTVRGSR